MNILLRNVTIADPSSPWNGKRVNLHVAEGIYQSIQDAGVNGKSGTAVEEKDASGLYLSPGWVDLRASFREPGEEQKETVQSGLNAATQGGYTAVLVMPDTQPAVDTPATVQFLKDRAAGHLVDLLIAGALTNKREGKEMAELFNMKEAGATAFTEGKRSISDSGLLNRILQYSSTLNRLVISYTDDASLSGQSPVNESLNTLLLGFKGAPDIAEVNAIHRDLELAHYCGVRIHLSGISSAAAVETLRYYRSKGYRFTAEVYPAHLYFDDSALSGFDTNLKLKPPLRSRADVEALREALRDGTIDAVASDHSPQDPESKLLEFDYAAWGMISLETSYAVVQTAMGPSFDPSDVARVLSLQPRLLLGLDPLSIQQGARVNCTLFNPTEEWTVSKNDYRSRSSNSPLTGHTLTGKVKGVGNKGQWLWV